MMTMVTAMAGAGPKFEELRKPSAGDVPSTAPALTPLGGTESRQAWERRRVELRRAWDREYSGDASFEGALATAVRYGILRPVPGGDGEYAMHPMVRHYLRRLYSK